MPLDPALQGMLALLESLDRPLLSSSTPEEARRSLHTLTVGLRDPAHVVPVGSTEDLELAGAAGPLGARVYRPDTADAAVPTIVYLHGGGFVIGDIETHDNQCRWVCRQVGAVVVSVDYRLAPEAPFPAAVEDSVTAVRWAAEHIAELGRDPGRLAVAGDSAGGNLAAVAAQICRDQGGPPLAAQLLIYPATDFVDDGGEVHRSRLDNAEGFFLTAEDMLWFRDHYVRHVDDHTHPHLSPLHGELAGLPPAVVVTAEFDPLRDEGDAYARALEAAGVPVIHRCFDGLIHGFFDLPALSPACEAAVTATCAAFRTILEPTRDSSAA